MVMERHLFASRKSYQKKENNLTIDKNFVYRYNYEGKVVFPMKMDVKVLKYLSLVSQIGLIMSIPIFAGVFLGNLVDTKLGTNGIFLILFILMGVYIAFRNLYVTIMRRIDADQKDRK